jgi:hypothetical protein
MFVEAARVLDGMRWMLSIAVIGYAAVPDGACCRRLIAGRPS